MSRAFTKEGDASDDLPERPVSDRPNYVTPAGMRALQDQQEALLRRRSELFKQRSPETEAEFKRVERDLRYVQARIGSAILVDQSALKPAEVRFGATVELQDGASSRTVTIVGEDEADPAAGKLSWASPLALALMGAKAGDEVTPEGGTAVRVVTVSY